MKAAKALARARDNPRGMRFSELVKVVESVGFVLRRQRGSHRLFAHPAIRGLLNLQEVGGMAKPYQVRQFLAFVDQYHLGVREGS